MEDFSGSHDNVVAGWIRADSKCQCSGMLPGHISGFYTYDECHVDLSVLATFANARLIVAAATSINWEARLLPPTICIHIHIHARALPAVKSKCHSQ